MLGFHRSWNQAFRRAPARLAAKLGLSPNQVTLASLALCAVAAAFIWQRQYLVGGILALVAACLDFVDGELARLTHRETAWGGYLDSLVDRFVDFFLLLAIVASLNDTRAWWIGSVALFGSLATSFAKSRVYEIRHVPKDTWRHDILERPDRYAILLPALFGQAVVQAMGRSEAILFWGLAILAVLSMATVIQRMWAAWRVLRT